MECVAGLVMGEDEVLVPPELTDEQVLRALENVQHAVVGILERLLHYSMHYALLLHSMMIMHSLMHYQVERHGPSDDSLVPLDRFLEGHEQALTTAPQSMHCSDFF